MMTLKIVNLQSGPYETNETKGNRIERLVTQFDKAVLEEPNADLVVFPELMTVPYFCTIKDERFFDLAESLTGETYQLFSEKAKENNKHVVITIFEKKETQYFNTAILISDTGEVAGVYRKTHVPTLELPTLTTDEAFYFNRGTEFPVFNVKGYNVGILICFDRSFPEAARALALQGADVIIIPTAAGGTERQSSWLAECASRARENGLYVVGVNKAGEEIIKNDLAERVGGYFGLTCAFDPSGNELLHLNDQPWQHMSVGINKELIHDTRKKMNFLNFLQNDLYHSYFSELQMIRSFEVPKEISPLFGPKGVVTID